MCGGWWGEDTSGGGKQGELEEALAILERTVTAEMQVEVAKLVAQHAEQMRNTERQQLQLEVKVAVMESENRMKAQHLAENEDVEVRTWVLGAISGGVVVGLVGAVAFAVMARRR